MLNIKVIILALAIFNGVLQMTNCCNFKSSGASKLAKGQNCEVKWSNDLPSWYPLVFNGSGIIYPRRSGESNEWNLVIRRSSNFKLGCPPDKKKANSLKGYDREEVVVRCVSQGLTIDSKPVNFSQLACTNPVKEKLVVTGGCYSDSSAIDILFTSSSTSLPLINVCHDTNTDDTHYAHHFIIGAGLNPYEVSNNRPTFKEGQFYTKISANDAYTQNSQQNQVALLVGSQALAEKYIDTSKQLYFARGHLAPDGDFVHVYQQNATYYFINVMPQWQSINNGNWKALETAVRNYAKGQNKDLEIWTGGKGILKLDDVNGNPVEIYLARDSSGQSRLPAPEITWKVIKDPIRNVAVAAFMINNPHLTEVPAELKVCSDVSSQISWATWDLTNISKGYTYFCTVRDARAALPLPEDTLEELSSLDLMT